MGEREKETVAHVTLHANTSRFSCRVRRICSRPTETRDEKRQPAPPAIPLTYLWRARAKLTPRVRACARSRRPADRDRETLSRTRKLHSIVEENGDSRAPQRAYTRGCSLLLVLCMPREKPRARGAIARENVCIAHAHSHDERKFQATSILCLTFFNT